MDLGRLDDETTANVGRIEGGRATNVVAGSCIMTGECRSIDAAKAEAVRGRWTRPCTRRPSRAGAAWRSCGPRSTTASGSTRPIRCLTLLEEACASVGVTPRRFSTGGGSDGNILAAKGLPTLVLSCGMSEVHSTGEHVARRRPRGDGARPAGGARPRGRVHETRLGCRDRRHGRARGSSAPRGDAGRGRDRGWRSTTPRSRARVLRATPCCSTRRRSTSDSGRAARTSSWPGSRSGECAREWRLDDPSPGHVMKLRYTPLQRDVLAVESQESPHHEALAAAEDVGRHAGGVLRSAQPGPARGRRRSRNASPSARVVYCMTDEAALPLALSDLVPACRAAGPARRHGHVRPVVRRGVRGGDAALRLCSRPAMSRGGRGHRRHRAGRRGHRAVGSATAAWPWVRPSTPRRASADGLWPFCASRSPTRANGTAG